MRKLPVKIDHLQKFNPVKISRYTVLTSGFVIGSEDWSGGGAGE